MKVAVAGSSGFVGSALVRELRSAGHTVTQIVRHKPRSDDEAGWDIHSGRIDVEKLARTDAFINLAGEPMSNRWTPATRQRIRDSRVLGAGLLASAASQIEPRPAVFICASALGYYGNRGEERLSEEAPAGNGFLAEVAQEWEAACGPASDAGIRVVNTRFALVLAREGGVLKELLPPFRVGLGAWFGSGRQYWPWIHRADLVSAMLFLLATPSVAGPVNFCAPEQVTNREFSKAVGRALGRPVFLAVPWPAARLIVGPGYRETLYFSQRMVPSRLQAAGFAWKYPRLAEALERELGGRT